MDARQFETMSDEELGRHLRPILEQLNRDRVAPTAKPLKGWYEFARRYGISMDYDEPLATRVREWFEAAEK